MRRHTQTLLHTCTPRFSRRSSCRTCSSVVTHSERDHEQEGSAERLGMLRVHTYVFVFLWIDDGVTRGKHAAGICELGAPELGVIL